MKLSDAVLDHRKKHLDPSLIRDALAGNGLKEARFSNGVVIHHGWAVEPYGRHVTVKHTKGEFDTVTGPDRERLVQRYATVLDEAGYRVQRVPGRYALKIRAAT